MTAKTRVPITPQTKVAELLDAYPELEETLVELAPPFRKLRNPVLRRTIARVTSLEKAATVAGLPLRELIVTLRQAAGQSVDADDIVPSEHGAAGAADGPADWVDASRVVWTIEADELLESGREPLHEVQQKARALGDGQLGLIRSGFRPEPLIDLLAKQRYRVAVVQSEGRFATFVAPRSG